jgi:hypothetical protein
MDGDKKGKIFHQPTERERSRQETEPLIHKHEIFPSPRTRRGTLIGSNCENERGREERREGKKANYEKLESYIIFISNEINKFYYFNDS